MSDRIVDERFVEFPCGDDRLAAILHAPAQPRSVGVVVIVGGFQYRVGSHRQFVLLARDLARAGIPVLRFDCRGMGDSTGHFRGFEYIEDDIRAAVDAFFAHQPGLDGVVLWGLCNAAASNMYYATKDPRVRGLVLINPWVRTEQGIARAYLRYYYLKRMLQRELWQRLFRGELNLRATIASFVSTVANAFRRKPAGPARPEAGADLVAWGELGLPDEALHDRMHDGLRQFRGKVLFQISGADLTGREFDDLWKGSRAWRRLMKRDNVTIRYLQEADHTYTTRRDLDQATEMTREFVSRL